jgi:hypothetical protein
VAVDVGVEIHLGHSVEPDLFEHVEQHHDLNAVAGRERQPLEQRAPRGDLAGQRLAHTGERRVEDGERRTREQMVHAAAAVGQRDVALAKRPPVEGLDELDLVELDQRSEQADRVVRGELEHVGVKEAHEIAIEHAERAPHRVALSRDRSVGAHQGGLGKDARARVGGDPRRVVARSAVDHHELVDRAPLTQAGEHLDDRTDRHRAVARGQADRRRALACYERNLVVAGMVEAASLPPVFRRVERHLPLLWQGVSTAAAKLLSRRFARCLSLRRPRPAAKPR